MQHGTPLCHRFVSLLPGLQLLLAGTLRLQVCQADIEIGLGLLVFFGAIQRYLRVFPGQSQVFGSLHGLGHLDIDQLAVAPIRLGLAALD